MDFRGKKSTETAMLQALNDWTQILDSGASLDVVYFDFSKAFERVCHFKLRAKLEMVGIHPRIISWISAFLHDRCFSVRINQCYSAPRKVHSGVPQGCVLSPVLFNIYTYELPGLISASGIKCVQFADDLKMYHAAVSLNSISLMQNAISIVEQWSKVWNLLLSKEKTKVLHLGKGDPSHSYTIDDSEIEKVNQLLDLGFLINKDLTFESHCDQVASKAMGVVHNLFRSLSTRNTSVLIKAYKTYVRPILEYGTSVFSPHKKKSAVKLEKVQNSFTRKLLIRKEGFVYSAIPSSTSRNKKFGLDSLAVRRRRNDLVMVHKILHEFCGLNKEDFFEMRQSRTRGGEEKIVLHNARTAARRNFFVNRAGSDYLKLDKKVTIPYKIGSFVRTADRFVKTQAPTS